MKLSSILAIVVILLLSTTNCHKKNPEKNLLEFNERFFQSYISELPEARLLQKSDLPPLQQQFFDEAKGQLQVLTDLNKNGIPEYIVAGISEHYFRNNIKKPYFIAIFERQKDGIKRLFFQQVYVAPVNISITNNGSLSKIIISFAFYSGYGAEIYYKDDTYHLVKW